jgi:hypothetical protein
VTLAEWLTLALLALAAGGLCAGLWFQVRREIPTKHRPRFFVGVFLVWLWFVYRHRRSRGAPLTNRVQATQDEFRIEFGVSGVRTACFKCSAIPSTNTEMVTMRTSNENRGGDCRF